jgi:hypothetical protein
MMVLCASMDDTGSLATEDRAERCVDERFVSGGQDPGDHALRCLRRSPFDVRFSGGLTTYITKPAPVLYLYPSIHNSAHFTAVSTSLH